MAKLSTNEIRELAKKLVSQNQGGIRYSDLVSQIKADNPETPLNTINGSVWDLANRFPREISKPSRGLFVPLPLPNVPASAPTGTLPTQLREEDFYEPFADWLKGNLDEATIAISLGGAGLQKKWGTPDVVGVYKPLASDRIKFSPEIISAEIKVDPQAPVVAFGQAVAYRLFSAKSYVVMPDTLSEEDKSRIEALCMLFGIGLVLFKTNVDNPDFQIRVRAQRFSPDMFYVNEFAERIHQLYPNAFNDLFG